jgi:maltooligosyltrehalose synthase
VTGARAKGIGMVMDMIVNHVGDRKNAFSGEGLSLSEKQA